MTRLKSAREMICSFLPVLNPLLPIAALLLFGCGFSNDRSSEATEAQLKTARLQMVEKQLRQRGIGDERVLQVMATIPRHLFVPPALQFRAYE
ncbi:MAG: hypothetical protein ACREQ3_20895, partial [Candidatus Binatia bacterium]